MDAEPAEEAQFDIFFWRGSILASACSASF
jgi:hypothetical protein